MKFSVWFGTVCLLLLMTLSDWAAAQTAETTLNKGVAAQKTDQLDLALELVSCPVNID